jgi:hypothetical protein
MNRFHKLIQAALNLMILAALSSCTGGQTATAAPTVDIGAVKTAAAATAIVELTKIAGQASPTTAPSRTPTTTPAAQTPAQTANATVAAGGLPATETPVVAPMAGTPAVPSLTPFKTAAPANTGPTCYNSKFVADVSIPDGTVMQPGEKFTKIWRFQNTGTCSWDQGFGFVRWAGPDMGGADQYFSNHDQPVGAGGVIDFYVEMRAPDEAGEYIANCIMINDSGTTFGNECTVVIKVVK